MRAIKQTLQTIVTTSAVLLGAASAPTLHAEHPFRGAEGPTDWQWDIRYILSERSLNGQETRTTDIASILKYWPKNPNWLFAGISAPYRYIDAGARDADGFGDTTISLGPRGVFKGSSGSFHYAFVGGLRLPTGDSGAKPALGSGSVDYVANLGMTYFTPDKRFGVDAAAVYTFAGDNRETRADVISYGAVIGAKLTKESPLRFFTGLVGTYEFGCKEDGFNRFSWRTGLRFTPPKTKRWHLEAWFDRDIRARGLPVGNSGALVLRVNLGKEK
jgi:hypothetical protein